MEEDLEDLDDLEEAEEAEDIVILLKESTRWLRFLRFSKLVDFFLKMLLVGVLLFSLICLSLVFGIGGKGGVATTEDDDFACAILRTSLFFSLGGLPLEAL